MMIKVVHAILLLWGLIGIYMNQVKGHESAFISVEVIKRIIALDRDFTNYLMLQRETITENQEHVDSYIRSYTAAEDAARKMVLRRNITNISNEILIDEMAKNPLTAFHVIRQLTMDVENLTPLLIGLPEFNTTFRQHFRRWNLTFDEDVVGAGKGLIRLQDVYHLEARKLIHGKIWHLDTGMKLSVADCLAIAQIANLTYRLDAYVEWAEQAQQVCLENKDTEQGCQDITEKTLNAAVQLHDSLITKADRRVYRVLAVEVKRRSASDQIAHTNKLYNPVVTPSLENSLCYVSGPLMSPEKLSKLTCHYLVRDAEPYLTLERYKVEVQSIEPLIWTILDVITSKEADMLKAMASKKLTRSTVLGVSDKSLREFSDQRISSTSWLADNEYPEVDAISQRIQRITGLSTAYPDAEQFQFVNYGIGGMYNAHYDYMFSKLEADELRHDDSSMGNRIVTFILYLEDVELGGATAFPQARTAVRPQKGAAAMWFNIDSAGDPDANSFHGGCPVLYGSKWIANKWILERGQMFRYPCPLTQPKNELR